MTNWTDRDTQDLRRIGETELGDSLTASDLDTIAMAANEMERLQARVVELEAERDVLNGSWCYENQSEGRGPCGVCVTCLKHGTPRATQDAVDAVRAPLVQRIVVLEAEMRAASMHTKELRMLLVGAVKFLQAVLTGTPDTSRLSRFVDEATDYLNRTSDPSDILRNVPK